MKTTSAVTPETRSVNVVVPVYRGVAETRRCLDSLLGSDLPSDCRITLIDDCGPEPEMADLLRCYADVQRVTLLHNPENQGFVVSVNRGMVHWPDHDPVLLNSDTEVPPGWLQRLQHCAYSVANVGTVTPFSNNATICSYPRFCMDNQMPEGTSLSGLDKLFQTANRGISIDIPTAVGFCMLIRRECLNEIGLFDVKNFGRGYGEENDFCMRAIKKGWRHVLCGDTFVFHAGAVSFANEHSIRTKAAQAVLENLHPRYTLLVRKHLLADPAAIMRQRVDLMRLRSSGRPVIALISHDLGGGVLRHVRELTTVFSGSVEFLMLRAAIGHQIEVSWIRDGESLRLYFHGNRDWQALQDLFKAVGVSRLHFHHWLGLQDSIWQLPTLCGIPYDVSIHDYSTICPRINLVDGTGQYCGEPDEASCNSCMARLPRVPGDIVGWREKWLSRLSNADRILTPSHDVATRLKRYFTEISPIVAPHPDVSGPLIEPTPGARSSDRPFTILAIGALSQIKGGALLEECALDAARRKLPIRFHLIGYAWRRLHAPEAWLFVTGRYREEDLPLLISTAGADIAWFPALWPETYSYTLSEALKAALPVAVTNLGAPPERVSARHWTWVCDWRWNARRWNDFFMSIRDEHFLATQPPQPPAGQATNATWDWRSDYLISSVIAAQTEPESLQAFADTYSKPRLGIWERGMVLVRRSVLMAGLRLRRHTLTNFLIASIPSELQHKLRRWIAG